MTTLLIITGPQGSGNHLFSKIFALHPAVNGWKDLNETYWIGHDEEPFSELWHDLSLIKKYDWTTHQYHVTSISCPYRYHGADAWPQYREFISEVKSLGIDVKIGIIGRDKNILEFQEQRLRDRVTYLDFFRYINELDDCDPVFLSQELVYLYDRIYLKQVSKQLDFPIDYNNPMINEILKEDSNKKYLTPVESNWLDPLIRSASNKN